MNNSITVNAYTKEETNIPYLVGTLGELYLKADNNYSRSCDLYYVNWNTGKRCILDVKESLEGKTIIEFHNWKPSQKEKEKNKNK